MKRLTMLLCLLAAPALAADWDTVAVLDSATNVTAGVTPPANTVGGTSYVTPQYNTWLLENGGSAAVFCSLNPSVTVNDGHKIAADGWRSFPNDGPVYCIAAASQTGVARDHLIVWGSRQ